MKSISLSDLQADLDSVLDLAQKERVVITRNGKPSIVVVGIEDYDEEDWRRVTSPDFWQLIEERRQGRSLPLAEVRRRLEGRQPSVPSPKATGGRRKSRNKSSDRPAGEKKRSE
jgi:prevent-host-death family protein